MTGLITTGPKAGNLPVRIRHPQHATDEDTCPVQSRFLQAQQIRVFGHPSHLAAALACPRVLVTVASREEVRIAVLAAEFALGSPNERPALDGELPSAVGAFEDLAECRVPRPAVHGFGLPHLVVDSARARARAQAGHVERVVLDAEDDALAGGNVLGPAGQRLGQFCGLNGGRNRAQPRGRVRGRRGRPSVALVSRAESLVTWSSQANSWSIPPKG